MKPWFGKKHNTKGNVENIHLKMIFFFNCIFTFTVWKENEQKPSMFAIYYLLIIYQKYLNTSVPAQKFKISKTLFLLSWYDGLGQPGGLSAAASCTAGPCYTTTMEGNWKVWFPISSYLFKFWEFLVPSQSFQVVKSIDIIQSIAVECFRNRRSFWTLFENNGEDFGYR